jgi:hypothetical protein
VTQRSEFHSILQHEGVDGLIMVNGGSAPVASVEPAVGPYELGNLSVETAAVRS